MTKVFIDGSAGTTGLEIRERLSARNDIELLSISEKDRKNIQVRLELIAKSDITFLCLPDESSKEVVYAIEENNVNARIIDTSTAHRTLPDWTYGFPELGFQTKIKNSKRVANPGCHATGFISIAFPLITQNLISKSAQLSCFSITGYSGGGKKMIANYKDCKRSHSLDSAGIYGLNMHHKHLAEMKHVCNLEQEPVFCPIVDNYPRGMASTIMFNKEQVNAGINIKDIVESLHSFYERSTLINVIDNSVPSFSKDVPPIYTTIYGNSKAKTDSLDIVVSGNNDEFIITALFDNLGKGACGAAIENMNIMIDAPLEAGLIL